MLEILTLFVFGFILLLKGADILTDAAASIAKKLGIANFVIGVVIVGIGTSIPEFIITTLSHLQGFTDIGVGTVIGSNTFNILVILGVASLIAPLAITRSELWRHLPINILAVVLVGALVMLSGSFFGLTRLSGIILVIVFLLWIEYLHFVNKSLRAEDHATYSARLRPTSVNVALIVGSLIGIVIGGEWVTESSITIAKALGISEAVIGLTIVGIGTSLPELFASAVAAYKKNYGIALGNVIGSNIFDFLMILGVSSAMKPMPFTPSLLTHLWITAATAVLLFAAVLIGKKYVLERWEGFFLLLLYGAYIVYLFSNRISP